MIPKVILLNSISVNGISNDIRIESETINQIKHESKFDALLMDTNTLKILCKTGSWDKSEKSNNVNIPFLVVPDVNGDFKSWKKILKNYNIKELLVICSRATPQQYLNFLDEDGIKYMIIGYNDVNFPTALEELNIQFGVKTVLVNGDGFLNSKLVRDDLVEEINVLITPKLDIGVNNKQDVYMDIVDDFQNLDLRLLDIKKLKNEIIFIKYRVMRYVF
jgi:2,5-diamino-6-(ribosylamino)-4(3H)-pyrimidinone 5'-phosphate reductase